MARGEHPDKMKSALSYSLAPLGERAGERGILCPECANDMCVELVTNQLRTAR